MKERKKKKKNEIKRHFVLGQKISGRSLGSDGCWRQQQMPQQYSSSRSISRSKPDPDSPAGVVDGVAVDGVGCDGVDEVGVVLGVSSSDSVEEEDSHSSGPRLREGGHKSGSVEETNESRLRFFRLGRLM